MAFYKLNFTKKIFMRMKFYNLAVEGKFIVCLVLKYRKKIVVQRLLYVNIVCQYSSLHFFCVLYLICFKK